LVYHHSQKYVSAKYSMHRNSLRNLLMVFETKVCPKAKELLLAGTQLQLYEIEELFV
jgi:hypothetical protein